MEIGNDHTFVSQIFFFSDYALNPPPPPPAASPLSSKKKKNYINCTTANY